MYKNLRINKTFTLVIPFFIYLSLISIYISSLGLMDDFNYINMNFFQNSPSYVEFIIGDIDSGGFRPFLPFQITLNNIGYYLFSVKGYFLFNLFFLFLILEFFYITMKEYFNLDKFVYYFVFFSWPYSSDLVIHPSLQEKFIIFAISVFLFSIKNNKVFLSRFSAFCIPLIKIQSLIFIPFIYSVVKTHKNKKFYISYFLVSTFMVLFIFFNQPETYFNSRLDFSSVFKQTFLSPVNAVNLFLIVVTIFLSIKTNLKNKNILFGFLFSNILLVVFMSVYRDIGNYLNSLNIFFIVIYVLIIYDYILKRFASKIFHNIVKLNLIFIFIFVIISFTIPRFERMNSIDSVMNYSTGSEEEIYYSCLEGVQYLNTFQKNNLFLYLDDFQTIGNENFLFLSDTFQCNSVENIIIQKCEKIGITNFKYENSMKIIEYKC